MVWKVEVHHGLHEVVDDHLDAQKVGEELPLLVTMVVIMVMEVVEEVDDPLPGEVQVAMEVVVEMVMEMEEMTPFHHLTKNNHDAIDPEGIHGCT